MEQFFLLVVGCAVLGVFIFILAMGKRKEKRNWMIAWFAKHGMTPEYNYQDVLGIDSKAGKAFIYTDAAWVLMPGDVRSVEKSSIHETKYNAYGMGFHKDKQCKLILHTKSMDQPIQVIGFHNKNDMDLWYSRLSLFFNLS